MIGPRRLIGTAVAAVALATGLGSAAIAAQSAPASASRASRASRASGTSAVSGASAEAAAVSPCLTSNLAIWVNQHGTRDTNVFYFRLEFTNLGSTTCYLRGYPSVWPFLSNDSRTGRNAFQDTGAPVVTADLAPGGTAHALLGYWTSVIGQTSTCKPVTAATLRVFPPGQTREQTFFSKKVCSVGGSNTGPRDLSIRAIHPGL